MIAAWSTNPPPELPANRFGRWQVHYVEKATAIQGHGALAATVSERRYRHYVLPGQGTLSATAEKVAHRTANLTGNNWLWANCYIITTAGTPNFPGHGQLFGVLGGGVDGLHAQAIPGARDAGATGSHGSLASLVTNIKYAVAAQLSGHGGLKGTAPVPASLHGAGQVQAVVLSGLARVATLSGSGQLVVVPNDGLHAGVYARSGISESGGGHGSLGIVAFARYATISAQAGHGVLTASARMYQLYRSSTPTGQGALTAAVYAKRPAAAVITGHGTLAGTNPNSQYGRVAALPGTGVLSALARMYQASRSGPVAGHGVVSSSPFARYPAITAQSGHGVASALARMYQLYRPSVLPGHGQIASASTPFARYSFAGTLPGHGVLSATAITLSIPRTATLVGQGVSSAAATPKYVRAGALSGAGTLSAVAARWTPLNITGVQIWLDASQISGKVDGDTVTSWPDLSGHSANAVNGALSPPTYRTNVKNGLPVVRFVSASNQALRATFTDSTEWVMFAVGRYTGGSNARLVGSVYPDNANWLLGWWGGHEDVAYYNGWASPTGELPTDEWKCYMGGYTAGSFEGVSGQGWFRKMGMPYANAVGASSSPKGALALSGYAATGPAELSDGEVAEVIYYDHFLTDTEITTVEAYLMAKWAIAQYTFTTALSGHGVLSATAFPKYQRTAALGSGMVGLLTAVVATAVPRSATAIGHGVVSTTVYAKYAAPSSTTGIGALSAAAFKELNAVGSLNGNGALGVSLTKQVYPVTEAGTGHGALAQSVTSIASYARASVLSGHGVLSATATPAFIAFNETNTARTNQARPVGTSGCWVTLIGAGSGGGNGKAGTNSGGGGGGGGGARISRVFVPVASLGATYSVTQGAGGSTGTASTFTSASVSLSAGAGGRGATPVGSAGGAAGTAGTATVSGITATSYSGTAGGAGGSYTALGLAGVNNTNNAGPGGGGGGGYQTSTGRGGGKGGDSTTITGGAGGLLGTGNAVTPSNATAGNAGGGGGGGNGSGNPGAAGSTSGAGGGGGGGYGRLGGGGANGYTLIEWV